MKAHTITPVLLTALLLASTGSQSLANLSGSDDFNDNVRDPSKWSIEVPRLNEVNGRLEFASTGTGDEEGIWAWIANEGSQTRDWSVTIMAANTSTPPIGQFCGMGLFVVNSADDTDSFGVLLAVDGEAGRLVGSLWETDGVESETWEPLTPSTATLRISYDASTGELSSEYDTGGGYSSVTSFDVSNWSMSTSDTFYIAIFGLSGNSFAVSSGQMYADNFEATSSSGDDNYEENDIRAEAYYPGYDWEQTWLSDIDGLGIQSDDDWYRIEVESGFEHVTVTCLFTHAEGDIDIVLCDSSGTELSDSYSVTDNEVIDYVVPGAGVYYIHAYYGDEGNSYDLWWDDLQTTSGISNHLDFVLLSHTYNYGDPMLSGDSSYEFNLNADTDDTVTSITCITPLNEILTATSDGIDGGMQTWRHDIDSPTSLVSRFGVGSYTITATYSNGTQQSTVFEFPSLSGVSMQPSFIAPDPLHGALFSPTDPSSSNALITLRWDQIDANANVVDLHRHHVGLDNWERLGLFTDLVPFSDGPFSTRSVGPLSFTPGTWGVENFNGNAAAQTNADGVFYVILNETLTEYVFTVLEASDDHDGDGLLNWWESLYFGGPTNAIASLDSDLDGHNNLQESITGMDPTNAASVFMITNSMPLADDFLIEWPSVEGRVYTAYWSPNLTNSFQSMGSDIDYPQNSYTDTVHNVEDKCFYKVDVRKK